MFAALPDMLGVARDTRPLELVHALENLQSTLQHQARQGNEEAGRNLLRLRLAYLRWAYGASHKHR